jgi:hypothetical protein
VGTDLPRTPEARLAAFDEMEPTIALMPASIFGIHVLLRVGRQARFNRSGQSFQYFRITVDGPIGEAIHVSIALIADGRSAILEHRSLEWSLYRPNTFCWHIFYLNLAKAFDNFVNLAPTVFEPIGGPYATDVPAQVLQDCLPQAVSIAGRLSRVITRAITFYAESKGPRLLPVSYADVDSKPRHSDLWLAFVATVLQRV